MRKLIAETKGVSLYQTPLNIFIIVYDEDVKQTTDAHKAVSLFVQCVRHALLKDLTCST
jgi:hypothetical protein